MSYMDDQKLIDDALDQLHELCEGEDPKLVNQLVTDIVNYSGGQIDMCSVCGSYPMTSNCNNANCG